MREEHTQNVTRKGIYVFHWTHWFLHAKVSYLEIQLELEDALSYVIWFESIWIEFLNKEIDITYAIIIVGYFVKNLYIFE